MPKPAAAAGANESYGGHDRLLAGSVIRFLAQERFGLKVCSCPYPEVGLQDCLWKKYSNTASSAVDLGGGGGSVRDEFKVEGSIICTCEYFMKRLVKIGPLLRKMT